MPSNVFMSIDYTESDNPPVYKAVVITPPTGDDIRFASGDPVADFRAAIEKGREIASHFGCRLMQSSSLTHFVWDVPGYRYDENDMLERDPTDSVPPG